MAVAMQATPPAGHAVMLPKLIAAPALSPANTVTFGAALASGAPSGQVGLAARDHVTVQPPAQLPLACSMPDVLTFRTMAPPLAVMTGPAGLLTCDSPRRLVAVVCHNSGRSGQPAMHDWV